MSDRARTWMFVLSLVPLAALLGWGISGLSPFGSYPGPYGNIINALGAAQRHVWNMATAVNFDYRGFDTMGEEFIMFVSVAGVALILREKQLQAKDDRTTLQETERADGIGVLSIALLPIVTVFAAYMALHGPNTPGGGFQGGAIAGSAFLLAYIGSGHKAFAAIGKTTAVEPLEALGAGAYVAIGLVALLLGDAFLTNYLPLGTAGNLWSGGTIWAINLAVFLEIGCGFLLVSGEFLKEIQPD